MLFCLFNHRHYFKPSFLSKAISRPGVLRDIAYLTEFSNFCLFRGSAQRSSQTRSDVTMFAFSLVRIISSICLANFSGTLGLPLHLWWFSYFQTNPHVRTQQLATDQERVASPVQWKQQQQIVRKNQEIDPAASKSDALANSAVTDNALHINCKEWQQCVLLLASNTHDEQFCLNARDMDTKLLVDGKLMANYKRPSVSYSCSITQIRQLLLLVADDTSANVIPGYS